ncbi:type II secretion system secretin GspD [Pendulispora rubella]|uniref:Type II secretion system secretin GspD n=1 Tax=Pendulispora rubella TaxID=2741070 RepID=A0ABZ2LGR2_9BACT
MNHLGRELLLAGASFCLGLSSLVACPRLVRAADPPFKPELAVKPVGPNEKINFQLVDAEVSELVRVVGGFTGKRFVIANNKIKSIRATIVAAQPITAAEAYQAFLSVLQANGLTVLERGTYYQIVESKDVERQNTSVVPNDSLPAEDRYVTQVLRLKNVRAEDVAESVLAKFQTRDGSIVPYAPGNLLIMTDTGSNLRRMMRLLEDIDVPNASEDKLYFEPIHYASATDVEKKLTEIFDLKKKDVPTNDGLHITKVIAIDRPNALAIVATPESYKRLLSIVRIMDQPLSNEGQINVVPLQHVDAKKIVQALNEAVNGAAPAGGGGAPPGAGGAAGSAPKAALSVLESTVKISADESTNSILVTSSPRDYASIKMVIDRLDRPKRQVYIEAVVMEITAESGFNFGVAWHGGNVASDGSLLYGGFRADKSALPPDASSLQAFALGIRTPEIPLPFSIPTGTGSSINSIPGLGMLITAAASTKGADILSTPSVVASDNTAAELKVQINTPLNPNAPPPSIIAGGTTLPGANTSNTNMLKIGPRIKITPHLNDSDEIRLDVDEQISDIISNPTTTYGSVISVERSATTTLTVKDEETVVIAGLMKNNVTKSVDKVPILGDIPVLGSLFRNTVESNSKSNLVLVLTPHIMRDKADRVRIFEKKMEERQAMIDHAALFGGQAWEPRKDFAHTHGLVGEIRKAYGETANKAALERARNQREMKTHEPREPVDMPTPIQTWGGSSDSSPSKPAGKPAPNVER